MIINCEYVESSFVPRWTARTSRTLSLEASVHSTRISVCWLLFSENYLAILVLSHYPLVSGCLLYCLRVHSFLNPSSCLQIVALLEVKYGVVWMDQVLPDVLLHIAFLFLIQFIDHLLDLRLVVVRKTLLLLSALR
jgi:hypothetical protein